MQWRGLPYGECTWENFQDIFKAEGQQCVDQFQVPPFYAALMRWHCIDTHLASHDRCRPPKARASKARAGGKAMPSWVTVILSSGRSPCERMRQQAFVQMYHIMGVLCVNSRSGCAEFRE